MVRISRKALEHAHRMALIFLFLMSIARAQANNSTDIQTAPNVITINLPQTISNNFLSGSAMSIWNEYIGWGILSTKQTVTEMKTAYGLTGIYDIPFLGPIFVSFYLLISGHIGALLFMVQNCLAFTLAGLIAIKLTIERTLRSLLRWNLLYETVEALLAAVIAIGIVSLF